MRRRGPAAYALLAVMSAAPAAAQEDSVTVVAGASYAVGPLHQRLLGTGYRDLWTLPVRVPVLDMGTFGGGLTAVRRGGGLQTRSLRLQGEDGREYNFRSVEKDLTQGLAPDLRETVVDVVLQDQVSALHPAAALVATGLLDAVGILNPAPRLVVLPDDARLGEFRAEFAGVLGTLEIHAEEAPDGSPDFAGAAEVESEDDFFDGLREDPENRVDAEAYLAERLMSLLMADWDRHEGQYRWARFDADGIRRWVPVPEDRDFALADYDGPLVGLLGALFPQATPFGAAYGDLLGLTRSSVEADQRLLSGLSWSAWQEVVDRIRSDLSDAEIEAAVRRMPPEYFRTSGPGLIRTLMARRDGLGEVARRFYLQVAAEAEIHATDEEDRAEIERLPDGSVRVTLSAAPGDSSRAAPYLERTFHPAETGEIRLYLYGGADRALVRGAALESVRVRIVGGAGADTLRDLSSVRGRGASTALYDEDEGVLEPGTEAVVDRTAYAEPLWIPGEVRPPRDWGDSRSWFVPWLDYQGTEGVIVGGGPAWSWYGFRRLPYAGRVQLRALYGLGSGRAGLDATAEFPGVGSAPGLWMHARVSDLEAYRFHGFGNASPGSEGASIVRYGQRLFEARLRYRPLPGLALSIGPRFESLRSQGGSPVAPAVRGLEKAGAVGALDLETRPDRAPLAGGFRLRTEAALFPAAWGLEEPLGRLHAEAAGFAPLSPRLLLAGRLGGAQVWGDPHLSEAALLGGSETLRGYRYQRFAGDAMVYGTLEARALLGRARLLLNGDLGVLAFADAGRVFHQGSSDGGWHRGTGAGLWFASSGRVVSATFARGERSVFYLALGMPF